MAPDDYSVAYRHDDEEVVEVGLVEVGVSQVGLEGGVKLEGLFLRGEPAYRVQLILGSQDTSTCTCTKM